MNARERYTVPVYRVALVRERTHDVESEERVREPRDARAILASYLEGADREHVVVILLDTQHRAIGINTVSIGSLDTAVIHPREVFKPAILASASAVIVGHNHVSGDPTPSPEDRKITKRLADAGRVLAIPMLDHVIIGAGARYVSMVEAGHMDDPIKEA